MAFERLQSLTESAVSSISVSSALYPVLWLCGIAVAAFTPAAVFTTGALQVYFAAMAGLPVILGFAIVGYLLIKDPERLQSEDYRLRRETLQMIGTRAGRIAVGETSLADILAQSRELPRRLPEDR